MRKINLKSWLILVSAIPFCLTAFQAKADIWTDCGIQAYLTAQGLGNSQFTANGFSDSFHSKQIYWAGFALNGGFIDSNPTDVAKNGDVWGDIGAAGTGNISLQDGFTLHKNMGRGGNLYYHTGGKYTKTAGAVVQGDVVSDGNADNVLGQGFNQALAVSDYAFGLAPTPVFVNGSLTPSMPTTVNLKNQNMSVSVIGTGNNCNVLRLQDFVIQGGTFTLQGTMTQSIIINVNHDFVMNGGANVVLSGGLKWDNVLFNIHGTGNVVSFDQNANLTGYVWAPKRHVRIKGGSIINGSVVGEEIELASLGQIRHPSVVSPIGP
jgi:hypothetical protein